MNSAESPVRSSDILLGSQMFYEVLDLGAVARLNMLRSVGFLIS